MVEKILNKNWKLIIDLDGGRIEELSFKDEVVLGTFERIDGKLGNTHICSPNFGSEGMKKFNLDFHGPFRKMKWELVNKNEENIEIEVIDLNLKVKQIFKIGDFFEQKVIIENLDDKERLVNIAIHNYWDSKNDWRGIKLNGKVVDDLIMKNTNSVLDKENLLEIAGKSLINWQVFGCKYGQFWTGFIDDDGNKKFDEKYVCIEPSLERQGFLDSEVKNNLEVGKKLEISQRIEVVNKRVD